MKIAVIGLGYVGAPLALELAKHVEVVGYDIDVSRVDELQLCQDRTNELDLQELAKTSLMLSYKTNDIADAEIYIVTVPTPVSEANVPDLGPVKAATKMLATILKPGDTVIYESTVYPGVTEEICVPLLEAGSNLKHLEHFHVGYSPERINPGDEVHTLTTTTKVVSGDDAETLNLVDALYSLITTTYRAQTIKVAEAAKVIENTQRDVNIALMNELSQIFTRLGVDTNDVIDAAASKWNFQPYRPGLVGGHCISVDPYYLTHKAATQGFVADMILSAREINDSMAAFIVDQLMKLLVRERLVSNNLVVTIIGATFKENVPDIRNSKVSDIVKLLRSYNIFPQLIDPLADSAEVKKKFGTALCTDLVPADAVIIAVPHEIIGIDWDFLNIIMKDKGVVMDLKGVLPRNQEGKILWRP